MKRKIFRLILAVSMLGMLQTGCGQKSETETPSGKEAEEDAGENEGTEGQRDSMMPCFPGAERSPDSPISRNSVLLWNFPGSGSPWTGKRQLLPWAMILQKKNL